MHKNYTYNKITDFSDYTNRLVKCSEEDKDLAYNLAINKKY